MTAKVFPIMTAEGAAAKLADMDKAQHGKCAACGAPLCFGPYECCAMFGQRWCGQAVVPGHEPSRRQAAIDVCCSAPCIAYVRQQDKARLAVLVTQVAAQLLAEPLPDPGNPEDIRGWAMRRARNILAGLHGERL